MKCLPHLIGGLPRAAALLLVILLGSHPRGAAAHEVVPAIADFTVVEQTMLLDLRLNLEAMMAGVDLSATLSTDTVPQAAAYDGLRALPAADIADRFTASWPEMARRIMVVADGLPLRAVLREVRVPSDTDPRLARTSLLQLSVALPDGTDTVSVGWDPAFGPLVLRQNGIADGYDGYLDPGEPSPPIRLSGGDAPTAWSTFLRYIPIGFDHIVPKGLDHILFVLGLFLFNSRLRPLLLQVTAFTAAHTVTLGAASAGLVSVPGWIVEPAIAASIIYIAVENITARGESALRVPMVFAFGLLHGLGFASVLGEFGLPEGGFVAALIGFNIGVELGQVVVIGIAFLLVGLWFNRHRYYRNAVVIPGSAAIGLMGTVWLIERIA